MKNPYVVLVMSSFLLLAGCGKQESAGSAAAAPAPNGPKTFELTANDTMKYNMNRLEVSAGEEV
jgi:plastocyanin